MAGEKVKSPTPMTQPTVTSTPTSMTTASRPIDSMSRHSSAAVPTQRPAASTLCCRGVMVVQTNWR